MILLNFSHPLTPQQQSQIEALVGHGGQQIINIPTQFDPQRPFEPQLVALLEQIPLTSEQWQTEEIILIPPALNFITALLLAELHGRMGYFPAIVRLRPVEGAAPPRFEVAEIINLQTVRDAARQRRTR